MPRKFSISSKNALKLKRKRSEERLRNEEKRIEEANEASFQRLDRFEKKWAARAHRKEKRESKRKSQHKSPPFVPQPCVGHAALEGVEPGTEKESTAMTVASSDVLDEAEKFQSRYLKAFEYAGKLARGDIPVIDQNGKVRRMSEAQAQTLQLVNAGASTSNGMRADLVMCKTEVRLVHTTKNKKISPNEHCRYPNSRHTHTLTTL